VKVPLPETDLGKTLNVPEPLIEIVSPFGAFAMSGHAVSSKLHNKPDPAKNWKVIVDFAAAALCVPSDAEIEIRAMIARIIRDFWVLA